MKGKLDTGFISRFQSRFTLQRGHDGGSDSAEQTQQDLAIIAAALDYSHRQGLTNNAVRPAESNAWRMAGRSALLQGRSSKIRRH